MPDDIIAKEFLDMHGIEDRIRRAALRCDVETVFRLLKSADEHFDHRIVDAIETAYDLGTFDRDLLHRSEMESVDGMAELLKIAVSGLSTCGCHNHLS